MPSRLIADIGGTNARFALSSNEGIHDELVLTCACYPDLSSAVEDYLLRVGAATESLRPRAAAVAIASPITGDHIRMTNHVWQFSAADVRRTLKLERFLVLNDFTALAMAIPYLPKNELTQVGGTRGVPDGPIALVGPGTGLGVSGLIQHSGQWLPLQGEGGHVTLAPADEHEAAILKLLWKQYPHVSAERLLSGPGLVLLYEALCELTGAAAQTFTPADITQLGLNGEDKTCREVLATFCAMLGTVAADVALILGAVGGVYIGGGVVPRLLDFFVHSGFRQRFEAKGRYKNYLAAIPAWVITSSQPALIGVARAFADPGPRLTAT